MKITQELYDKLKTLSESIHIDGLEFPNPIPVEAPLGIDRPPTLKEQIQRVMKIELGAQAAAQEMETFEESQDFDVDNDSFPGSKYELMEDEVPSSLYKQPPPKADEEDRPSENDNKKVENQSEVSEKETEK